MANPTEKLAILGAPPAFAEPLHVGKPNLGERAHFLQLVESILDRGWLTNDGPLVQQFEAEIAERSQVEHCVAMANGTLALQAAVRALELTGEVIVPSFTFVATAHALAWQGIRPVFCDINAQTHAIDPAAVEKAITPKTTGIIGVNLWGETCEIDELAKIATKHQIQLLFDSAHAFGCSYNGKSIGSFGRCEVFSFHATKFMQSAEGGAVVTNDAELAKKLRLIRNFGFHGSDDVGELGTNAKMTELSAAMGLTSLASINNFIAANRRNYHAYRAALTKLPGIELYSVNEGENRNYQYVVMLVSTEDCPLTRDEIICVLHAENVMARRYFHPGVHRMDAYRNVPTPILPITESIGESVIVLPTGMHVTEETIQQISSLISLATSSAAEVKREIKSRNLSPTDAQIVHNFKLK